MLGAYHAVCIIITRPNHDQVTIIVLLWSKLIVTTLTVTIQFQLLNTEQTMSSVQYAAQYLARLSLNLVHCIKGVIKATLCSTTAIIELQMSDVHAWMI